MSEKVQDTVLSTLADNLADSFFEGSASSSQVITPKDSEDKTDPTEPDKVNLDKSIVNPLKDTFSTDELIGDLLQKDDNEPVVVLDEPEEKRGPGRPRKEDTPFDFNQLIGEEFLLPFDDEEPIKDIEDLKELIKANKAEERRKGQEDAVKTYRESLPESINLILDYAENGGHDFDNFLKALGQVRKTTDLTTEKASDQKEIIRQYYSLQDWNSEEIEEYIEGLIDMGEDKLQSIATKLKPKLDQRQEEMVQYQLEESRKAKEQQERAQRAYVNNIVTTLKKGNLGDLKISKEEQKDLYNALVEERYQSVSGGTTNRLGALLDKIQFIEPDYDLLAQVMLLMNDPKSFKAKIKEEIKKEVTAETVKKIKSEQGSNKNGSSIDIPSGSRLKRLDSTFKNPFA